MTSVDSVVVFQPKTILLLLELSKEMVILRLLQVTTLAERSGCKPQSIKLPRKLQWFGISHRRILFLPQLQTIL